ncbi:extracellular glycoprotein lacritin [Nycticebus coucang]|uniref:extracellular glycoprotein lacritin n=1 Tax=Nycticebus coucang TaxID=9470 RepID=UPI00234C60DC|nr:extracellular glycoprotein lacritin [Nycticebus coucang]
MKFATLLLLVALAGALVCADDVPSDHPEAAPVQDTATPVLEDKTTGPASPQETTTAAAAQRPTQDAMQWQDLIPMRSLVENVLLQAEKSFQGAEKTFQGAEKKLRGRLQDGKQLVEGGSDFVQQLMKRFHPLKFWF